MHRNPCTNLYPIGSCSRELLIWTDLLSPFSPATSGRNLMKLSKGKCSVLSLDGVIPHTRTGWGPTCESTVSSWSFPSTKKGSDVLKWIQQHATKVSRGWKLKYRLRAESVQPEDEYGQISLLSANTWWVAVEKKQRQPLLRNACQKNESEHSQGATEKILIRYMTNKFTARVVKLDQAA